MKMNKKQAYFIAGTDTGVGKTLIASALVHSFVQHGLRSVGMKPIAAGCALRRGRLMSEDVEQLIAASNVDTADLAQALGLPVILVVGMRLGCLNHALLTAEAIKRRGLRLTGWVANRIDAEMLVYEENLQTLRQRLDVPCLGVLPWLGPQVTAADAAAYLQLPV